MGLELMANSRRETLLEVPDVRKELPIRSSLDAPLCHFWPVPSKMPACAAIDADKATPTREPDPDDEVRARQANVEARRIGSVHKPTVGLNDQGYDPPLLCPRSLDPTGKPEDFSIHREIWKVQSSRNLLRQRRLATTGTANDANPSRARQEPSRAVYIIDQLRHSEPPASNMPERDKPFPHTSKVQKIVSGPEASPAPPEAARSRHRHGARTASAGLPIPSGSLSNRRPSRRT